MKFNLIVSMCKKTRGIGYLNLLPWKLENDMKRFVKLTTGNKNNCVIMGKNTWDSLPKKPLKNRKNIILSSSMQKFKQVNYNQIKKQQVCSYNNIPDLLFAIENNNIDECWVIGGEKIYKEFLDLNIVSKIYITQILNKDTKPYDTFLPPLSKDYKLIEKRALITETRIVGPIVKKENYFYEIYQK
jgi:dihydrofolate reductase